VAGYDLVVDGTDAFETKFLLNDAAVLLHKPLVHGAVLQWGGQVTTVLPGGPCLRCLFKEPPEPDEAPTCEEAGIMGAATGVVGSVQAEEALKVLLNVGTPLSGRIFQHDGLGGEARVTTFPRDPNCPVCSPRARITTCRATTNRSRRAATSWCDAAHGRDRHLRRVGFLRMARRRGGGAG